MLDQTTPPNLSSWPGVFGDTGHTYNHPDLLPYILYNQDGDIDEREIKRVAEQAFRSANPKPTAELARQARNSDIATRVKRIAGLEKRRKNLDLYETFTTNKLIEPQNLTHLFLGKMTIALACALIIPMPFIVSAGIYESLLIERVDEDWRWGLAYGFAPIGGILGAHGLIESISNVRLRRIVEKILYLFAVLCFILWAYYYSHTFLTDSTASQAQNRLAAQSLGYWYWTHLALEFFGAAAAYNLAVHYLFPGYEKIHVPNEAIPLLDNAIENEQQNIDTLSAQEDADADELERYNNGQAVYVEVVLSQAQTIKKLIENSSSASSVQMLMTMMEEYSNANKGRT